jgi:class 3 adenylate cyclase/tetratricopeptide (TPR) repeat protein
MSDDSVREREQLEVAIVAQEGLRGVVPDEVVDAAVAALRHRLETSGAGAQRRRQITVLFADVSGFTSMSSDLDAEVVAGLMNELWSRLDSVITEHGGHIDKHIGDAVMAIWGAGSTEEDDPERAVRAAVAMQDEVAQPGSSGRLMMRIGINTGPAVLGAVGAGAEFTAMGDTVNVASRVQGLAPVGGVLITHDTYRHVRGVFDVEAVDPVRVKGKREPISVYVVRQAKARAFRLATRGVEGVETRMIGRARELGVLQAEFERVVAGDASRRVTVIGDAGIGKSRLLYEFVNWIDLHPTRAYFFKGRALANRRSAAYGLVRDLLVDRFGVLDSDSAAVVAEKLRRGLAPTLDADEAELVGHWLGFDLRSSASVQRLLGSGKLAAAARAHFFRYIDSLAADSPVVVFLEDLHWADDESLVLIDDLVAHSVELHLLVVGVGRPELMDRAVARDLLERSSATLRLSPLGAEATRELVGEIMQKAAAVPAELTDLIVDRADGNAFYVEELVKMLIEDGVIETGEPWETWQVHVERLDAGRVPATLTGVLQSRLDSLRPAERWALQRSSIVGRVFWDAAVASLGDDGLEATTTSLEIARERELIFRRDQSSFDDSAEYMFKHALLRDVTYETVLLRDRQRLHRLVAGWISDHAGERVGEYASLIATHHRLAGDLTAAAGLLGRAAAALLDAGDSSAARRNLDEAFEIWRASGIAPTVDALLAMSEACLRLGDLDAAVEHVEEALRREESPEQRAAALFLGSWAASERGELDRERTMLDEALPNAERHGGVLLIRVLTGLSWSEIVRGEADTAQQYAERALALSQQLQHPIIPREVLNILGAVAAIRGDLRGALHYSAEALAVAIQAGDLEGQALAESNIGVAHHLLGDGDRSQDEYRAALDHYENSRALNRRLGRRLQAGMTAANIAQIHVRLGDDPQARRWIHEALTTVRRSGGTATLLFCVLAEADRQLVNGDTGSALDLIRMVQRHPSLTNDNEAEIVRILSRAGLTDNVLQADLATGEGEDFDGLIERLVQELADRGGVS